MIVTCWSVKGGSGTSVIAGALAIAWSRTRPVLAVDLVGDLPAVLGVGAPAGPGVADWLRAGPGVGAGALLPLAVEVLPGLRLLPAGDDPGAGGGTSVGNGGGGVVPAERWHECLTALRDDGADVVVDAGLAPLPTAFGGAADLSLLVVRRCFLALRRVGSIADCPAGVVSVVEPGRALGRRDVERVVGVGTVAEVPLDPAVARAVDAGLLAARLPAPLARMADAVDRWAAGPAGPARTANRHAGAAEDAAAGAGR